MFVDNQKIKTNYIKIPQSNFIIGNKEVINEIGCWFRSDTFESENFEFLKALTVLHGRSCGYFHAKNQEIYILKGTGWTYGPCSYMNSPKDDELFFGIYDADSALREYRNSEYLLNNNIRCTEVVGFADISHYFPLELRFNNGKLVNPCILYTKSLSFYRVADLAYLSDAQKLQAILNVCQILKWPYELYFQNFSKELTSTIAKMHILGCCNDTLESGNVTLAAEITDFEWVTTPAVQLPVPEYYKNFEHRQAKEIIYLFETLVELNSFISHCDNIQDIVKMIVDAYVEILPESKDFLSRALFKL